jgi:hypothetical protein
MDFSFSIPSMAPTCAIAPMLAYPLSDSIYAGRKNNEHVAVRVVARQAYSEREKQTSLRFLIPHHRVAAIITFP